MVDYNSVSSKNNSEIESLLASVSTCAGVNEIRGSLREKMNDSHGEGVPARQI